MESTSSLFDVRLSIVKDGYIDYADADVDISINQPDVTPYYLLCFHRIISLISYHYILTDGTTMWRTTPCDYERLKVEWHTAQPLPPELKQKATELTGISR